MSILSACTWCKWANKLKGPQCKNWPCGATIISSTSTLGYFGARNAFLTIVLKNNHDINIKSKMAARTSHNRKGNCGILSKCCSYKGIMMIIIFYIFWDKEHHFWKKKIKAINIYMLSYYKSSSVCLFVCLSVCLFVPYLLRGPLTDLRQTWWVYVGGPRNCPWGVLFRKGQRLDGSTGHFHFPLYYICASLTPHSCKRRLCCYCI